MNLNQVILGDGYYLKDCGEFVWATWTPEPVALLWVWDTSTKDHLQFRTMVRPNTVTPAEFTSNEPKSNLFAHLASSQRRAWEMISQRLQSEANVARHTAEEHYKLELEVAKKEREEAEAKRQAMVAARTRGTQ